MNIKKHLTVSIMTGILFSGSVLAADVVRPQGGEGFTAGEHVTIGDEVVIHTNSQNNLLHLPNGMVLTYGEIVSLGDFYGTPKQPIALGKTQGDRSQIFMRAFSQFSSHTSVMPEVQKILDVTNEERAAVQQAILHGENVENVYKRISEDHNRRYNCITGGGCDGQWWLKPGRYLDLAASDYDHFGDTALVAYRVGHALAIQQALKAHETGDMHQLELAYAMNAFASHFLSDRFSSGHLRTPRQELDANATPAIVGGLLSHYMHDEEGVHGLHVHNARGDHWVAYGDKHYFDKDNAQHRHLLKEAMQVSADEVYAAFKTGLSAADEIKRIVPVPDVAGNQVGYDVAPMFYWDKEDAVLYRRQNLENIRDFHFKSDWWGWSTFLELSRIYGLPHG